MGVRFRSSWCPESALRMCTVRDAHSPLPWLATWHSATRSKTPRPAHSDCRAGDRAFAADRPRRAASGPFRGRYTEAVTTRQFAIGAAPLALEPLVSAIADHSDGIDGAIVTFYGLVRNHNQGRRVHHLEYEAYEPLALKAFARIDEEVRERWPGMRIALHHRIGRLEIGEASVAIVTASPHRADAFAACRYVIERVK